MAWGLRGTPTTGRITAGSGSQDVTLPSGTTTGDLVCVAVSGDISCADSITTAGYTLAENGTGANPGAHFGYKVMGASPDSVVAIARDGTILKSCVVMTFSGGLSNDILDTSINTAVTATSADADCGAIVTKTANALVVVVAHLDDDDSTVSTWPTGYSTWSVSERTTDGPGGTVGSTTAMCAAVVAVAGSENPGILSFSSVDANSVSAIAFRSTTYHQPFKSDTATVTDSTPVVSLVLVPVVSDSVGVTDTNQQTKLEPLRMSGADSASVTETSTAERQAATVEAATLSVTDSVSATDITADKLEPLVVSKSDSVAATEAITQTIYPLLIEKSDTVAVTEVLARIINPLVLSATDSVTVAETVAQIVTPLLVAGADATEIAEAVYRMLDSLGVMVADVVAIAEGISEELTEGSFQLTMGDAASVSDAIDVDVFDVPIEVGLMDYVAGMEGYPVRTIPNPLMALGHKSQDLTIQ